MGWCWNDKDLQQWDAPLKSSFHQRLCWPYKRSSSTLHWAKPSQVSNCNLSLFIWRKNQNTSWKGHVLGGFKDCCCCFPFISQMFRQIIQQSVCSICALWHHGMEITHEDPMSCVTFLRIFFSCASGRGYKIFPVCVSVHLSVNKPQCTQTNRSLPLVADDWFDWWFSMDYHENPCFFLPWNPMNVHVHS